MIDEHPDPLVKVRSITIHVLDSDFIHEGEEVAPNSQATCTNTDFDADSDADDDDDRDPDVNANTNVDVDTYAGGSRRRDRKILFCVAATAAVLFLSCVATGAVFLTMANKGRSDENRSDGGVAIVALGSPTENGEDDDDDDRLEPSSSADRSEGSDDLRPSVDLAAPPSTRGPTYAPTASPPTYRPSLSASPSTASPTERQPLRFYAVGDVPYSDVEACLLPHELRKLSASGTGGRFVVHLGDIQDGRSESCPESTYEDVATIFESSPVPAFFVVGDNEWLDCKGGGGAGGGADAAAAGEALGHWEEHLLRFHERKDVADWPALGANVRHHPDRPELYSFLLDDVLFLGQGLPYPQHENMPPPDKWRDYLTENADWTREELARNVGRTRAVVIFAHAAPDPYLEELRRIASSHDRIPMLLLTDYHWWEEWTYEGVPNLYRIALDDTVTPTSISVDVEAEGSSVRDVFRYDRRCWCSNDHRPTGLVRYPPGHECEGACDDAIELCAGENACGTDGATCE